MKPSTTPSKSSYPTLTFNPTISNHPTGPNPNLYSDWNILSLAIENAGIDGIGGIFKLQPGIIISQSPITVNSTGVIIQCGDLDDELCIIEGGGSQFIIIGSPKAVEFIGLTFIDGDGVSIIASGNVDSDVSFVECEWFVS